LSGFPAAQAARLGGCTRSQLGHWRRSGVVVPSHDDGTYSFRDLVALRVVVSLLETGLPMARVRAALQAIRTDGSSTSDDLAGLRIVTDGVSVFTCYDDGQILDALRNGQLALFVAVDRFVADLGADIEAFTAERDAFLTQLQAGSADSGGDGDETVVGHSVVTGVGIAR
jgi:DNA-binding transcriptional MerR regulator